MKGIHLESVVHVPREIWSRRLESVVLTQYRNLYKNVQEYTEVILSTSRLNNVIQSVT